MHQVLLSIGPVEIRVYGFLAAVSFLAGIYLAALLAKKEGIKQDVIMDLGLVIILGAIIGSRILYVIVGREHYINNPLDVFRIWEGGLVFYGGLIGAASLAVVWLHFKKLDPLRVMDIIAPFTALGHAIARIGCYYNGCCYGKPAETCGTVLGGPGDGIVRVPVQIYESAANFINFIVLIMYYKHVKKAKGEVFFLYFINYAVIRGVAEAFRGDAERGSIAGLTTSTFISLVLFIIGAAGFTAVKILYAKQKKD